MSKINRLYFKWENESTNLDIHLGDSKESLITKRLIKKVENEGEIDYTGVNGTPWRVDFHDDTISRIWFNRESSFKINGVEISGMCYEKIKPILESNFKSLNSEIKSIEEMKLYSDSNVLYVICRDFFVAMIGIIKPLKFE